MERELSVPAKLAGQQAWLELEQALGRGPRSEGVPGAPGLSAVPGSEPGAGRKLDRANTSVFLGSTPPGRVPSGGRPNTQSCPLQTPEGPRGSAEDR